MKIASALTYYLESTSTILYGFDNPFKVFEIALFGKGRVFLKYSFNFEVSKFMDLWALKEVILDDCYRLKNKHGNIAIDIGAGIGDFSISSSTKFKKIYSFESNPTTFEVFKRNLLANNISNTIAFKEDVTSLSEIFKREKITSCDFLKIDCEGSEYKIFDNSTDSIIKKVKNISMEVHFFNDAQMTKYLKLKTRLLKLGFKLQGKENPVHNNIGFLFASR